MSTRADLRPVNRRRRPAAAGRVLATGVGTSAFLGIVAVLAADAVPGGAEPGLDPVAGAAPASAPTVAPPPPVPTVVVVRRIHRKVHVDAQGRPVDPNAPGVASPPPAAQSGGTAPAPPRAERPSPTPQPQAAPAAPTCRGSRCG